MSRPSDILLLTGDSDRLRQWADMLASTSSRLWLGVEQLPANAPLDVIVTDGRVLDETLAARHQALANGEIGVVAAGAGGPADVSLPGNFTPRELRLACLLLTEIVRMRRERRRQRRQHKLLTHLARSDPLTGLANRRAWDDALAAHNQTAADTEPLCLALVDLDCFKQVNADLGHAAGDAALKAAADALLAEIRSDDFAARLGGDEFAVLLCGLPVDDAATVVERIRQSVSGPLEQVTHRPQTASAGFAASTPGQPPDIAALFQSADEALRRAKQIGRDQTVAGA